MRTIRKPKLAELVFPLLLFSVFFSAWLFRDTLYSVFSSPARIRALVESYGVWGVAVFIALQIFQVVVFVVPGEIAQIAGGWLFGVPRGVLYSVVGIALGSVLNFALARIFGRRFVAALFGARALDRFDGITRSDRAAAAFFLLFVVPGIPKDALCFAAGLSSMNPASFLAVSMAGRLPGIVGSALIGQAASNGRYALAAGIAAAASALFALGALFRNRIHAAVARAAESRKPPVNAEAERRREEA